MNKLIIISGCSGGGKSTLLSELSKNGYSVVPEIGRFMTPPWREIYSEDDERKHSFEDAVEEYSRLMKFYPQYGYHTVELPRVSVQERVEFLLSSIFPLSEIL